MKKISTYIIAFLICAIAFLGYKYYDFGRRLEGDRYVASFAGQRDLEKLSYDKRNINDNLRKQLDMNVSKVKPFYSLDSESNFMADSICSLLEKEKQNNSHFDKSEISKQVKTYEVFIVSAMKSYPLAPKLKTKFLNTIHSQSIFPANADDSLKFLLTEVNVRKMQNSLSRYLYAGIGKSDYKFDTYRAFVRSDRPVLKNGDDYVADIFLGAYDSHSNPDIKMEGGEILNVESGSAKYETRAIGEGKHPVEGEIIVTAPNGEKMPYRFKTCYYVVPKEKKQK